MNLLRSSLNNGHTTEAARGRTVPGWPWNRQPILLSGCPRTGTSWTGKVLSLAPSIRYVREPVLQGKPERDDECRFRYRTADDEAPEYEHAWRAVLRPSFLMANPWLVSQSSSWWKRRVPFLPAQLLVKENHASLALEWMADHFNMRIVISIRHPCGVVASAMRLANLKHSFIELDWILNQPALMEQYFTPGDREWMSQQTDPIARAAVGYGVVYKVIGDQLCRHPEWTLVYHWALCADPMGQFRRVFDALHLDFPARRVEELLSNSTEHDDGETYGLNRVSSREPEKWKSELTPTQIDTVASVIERFKLPFYRDFA
jgi:Sulfotransferase family